MTPIPESPLRYSSARYYELNENHFHFIKDLRKSFNLLVLEDRTKAHKKIIEINTVVDR